jgi:farnesyl diphosphate synthase
VHKAFDEATAILAGDALLTLAFEVMADGAIDARAQTRLDLTLALARAAGTAGMVGGQMHDLDAETLSARGLPPLGEAEIRRLQAMKTGALLAFAVDAGAMLGRTDAQTRRRLATYGQALGATFQIADDILDVEATAHELGKATGKDAARGKATLVAALGLERAKAERDRLAAVAVEALSGFGSEAEVMRDAARFMAKRRA